MINKRQYVILSFFLTRTLFLGSGFSLLVNLTKNNLIISNIIGLVLGLIILFFIYKKEAINKYVNICIAIFVLFICTLSNNVLTSTYLLYNTPVIFIMIAFFMIILYGSSKKMCIIGKVAEICAVLSFFAILLANIGLVPLVEFDKALPLFNETVINTLKGIIIFCGASILPNMLLINYKNEIKFRDVGFGYILGALTVLLVSVYISTIYGTQFGSVVRFPEYLILKKIDLFDLFSNLENVLIIEWIMNIIVSALVCTRVLQKNLSSKVFYLIIGSIILINQFFISKDYIVVLFIKNYFYYASFILMIIGIIIKKDKKQAK